MSESGTTVQVLLVDDEENILRALKRLLREEEIEVHTAASGEQALETLQGLANVGLIMSDQRMPGMSGSEFLHKSRSIAPDALRIILTGYADITTAVDAINKGGAYRYISKPWNDDELVHTVQDAIRQYSLLMENQRLNEVVRQQNEELQAWNSNLKGRVLEQTTAIRQKNDELRDALQKVKNSYDAIIDCFSGLVEMHGGKQKQHAHNVAALSVNVARELGITGDELDTIRIAALLHDIGEIGIPERVLLMPCDAMDADELRQYRQNPVRGQMTIDAIEDLRPAGRLIRHHHENFDGSGFPDGLAGESIPLGARIIAYADCIDKVAQTCFRDVADMALAKTGMLLGTTLDPSLRKTFGRIAERIYFSQGEERKEFVEVELDVKELRTGMLLSRDIRSGSGILLLSRGIVIDEIMLDSVRRNYKLDAPNHGVFVLLKR